MVNFMKYLSAANKFSSILTIFVFILCYSSIADLQAKDTLAVIHRVIDGDTFVIDNDRRVRLIGVDSPETSDDYYGQAKSLADSLLVGKKVRLEFDKEKYDKYNRLLVYLYLDDLFYNEYVISRGLAGVYLFGNSLKHAGKLINAQKKARSRKNGIWSKPVENAEKYYVSIRGSHRFHRPLCRAIKDANKRKIIRIENRDVALDKGLSRCRQCSP